MRRDYRIGRCEDCGRVRLTTAITFWLNGWRMRVCAECIRPYRGVILTPGRTERTEGS